MSRALRSLLVVLPLALAACSDSSKDKKSADTPYGGGTATPPPAPTTPPLTQSDVDKYVAVKLDAFKSKPKAEAAWKSLFERHGLTSTEWAALDEKMKRAKGAKVGFEKYQKPIPEHLVSSVELVKANWEKITKADEGKAVE
jgi:hypothetical protein